MGNEAKQRFVDLVVDEVSLVDSPANEQMFAVIKNLTKEIDEMGSETKTNVENTDVEKISVDVEKSNDIAVAKAMEQVTNMISNISKAVGSINPQNSKTSEKESEEKESPNVEKNKDEAVKKESKEKESKSTSETQTDVEKNEDEEATEKALTALFSAVEKAKRFTPKREAAFKAALSALTNLAKELGMMEIPVGASPSTSTPKGTQFGASSISTSKALKEMAAKIETAIEEIQSTQKNIGERIESIEKAKRPSNSVSGDGGTDSEVPVTKNFWAGVL